MKIKRRPMPAPHIPFISLADIAWQVIIFFFMSASFTKLDAFKIDSPSSAPQAAAQDDKVPTIVASEKGIKLDDQPVSLNRLKDSLIQRLKDKKKPGERIVMVEGKDDLTLQHHTEVMYAIEQAGAIPAISDQVGGSQQAP
jgi:biopolymer transport protein ExbD